MKYNIALLPGDGIGPEVMEAAVLVLKALEKKTDFGGKNKTIEFAEEVVKAL